ncbi:MAG TPA: hypothetical protein VFV71_05665, partial [Burkholderiales bacterium]|nr:hypothetical protein [Burkholderiales bacterium]
LDKWPRDLLALRLAQSCHFYLGWHDGFCDVADAVLAAWPRNRRSYGFVLAIASFAHAENGNADYAEALGLRALAIDAACPMGVHAIAHALAESGRSADGARWMREQVAHWAAESRMRTHNAWHLAMFDAMEGNLVSALGIADGWLLPAGTHSVLDACDATALLWRLATLGVDMGNRWSLVSDAFERNVTPGFWPYVDLHAAFAHWNARQPERLRALARAIDECAEESDYAALRARHITRPGLQALQAWTDGRHDQAIELFAGVRPRLGQMGGSRVQLEIFSSIEQEAVRRARRHGEQARRAA